MKKQLQQKDKAQMRKALQRFQENGTVIVYGYAKKQSGSGIFSNERLILLNSKEKSVRYYSKDPPGLPFDKVAQIPEGKGKIMMTEVKNFKYEPLKGKTTDMKMEWQQNTKTVNWIFIFENSKMMNDWIAAIEDTLKDAINKDPTFILPNNSNQTDKNLSKNPVNNQKKPSILDQNSSKPALSANISQPGDTKKQQTNQNPNLTSNQPPTQVNQSKSIQNSQIKPKIDQKVEPKENLEANNNKPPNSVLATNKPIVEQKNIPNQNLANKQSSLNQPQPITNKNQIKNSQEPNKNSTIQKKVEQKPLLSAGPEKNQSVKSGADKPLSTTQDQKPIGLNQNEPLKSSVISKPPNENKINQQPPQKVQYGDIAQQLKALRKNNPQKFNLTNDLSKKNLEKVEELPNEQNQVDTRRNNQSQNPYKKKQDPYYQSYNHSKNPQFILNEPKNSKIQGPQVLQNSNSPNSAQLMQKKDPVIPYDDSDQEFTNHNRSILRNQNINSRKDFNNHSQQQQKPMLSKNQMQRPTYQTPKQANNSRVSSSSLRNQGNKKIFELRGGGSKRWNQIWCGSSNPVDIYEEFSRFCTKTSVDIIDQLPFLKKNRSFSPLKSDGPYHLYLQDGISFNMHYFEDQNSPLESSRDDDQRAPILYDQQTYTQAKREFYNYNFLLGITGNKGQVKVPLVCYIQYKGVLIYCKANIPEGFQKVSPQFIEKYLDNLQQQIKIRFVYASMNLYMHPQKKYFLISQMEQLIPRLPNNVHPPAYFRKQYLLENNIFIDNQNSLNKLYQSLLNQKVKQFVNTIQSLQKWIINSTDLLKQMHLHGISLGCLPVIYEETNFPFFKKIIVSEMTKGVFCDILRSQLNGVYSNFPAKQFQQLNLEYVDKIVLDCAHVLLDQLFSYSSRSENIWRMIVKEVNKKFKVTISKEDILPGFLLGGIMNSIGIQCDYKNPELNRKQSFFIRKNTIPRDLLINFYPKTRKYDLQSIFPLLARVEEIISMDPVPDNYEQLVRILDLKNSSVPSFCDHIVPEINTYLCNFVPLGDQEEYEHLGLYQPLQQEPHTFCSTKICLLSIKWAAKKKNEQLANKIFQLKHEQNSFWVSQFNPAISQFYDFFALYNISSGNFEQAIKLAKSSLINTIKLTGANSLPTADKHYQLGNIYFKVGKKQQSLKEYLKTKQTLEQHRQTTIPEYGVILLKLSLLYLNFGKISDCVGNSLEALKIFDTNGGNQQQQIETFEILARSYQITRKFGDLSSVGALCSQKFNNTENPKIFERMIKIVLLPKLSSISIQDSKILLKLISKLQEIQSPISYLDAFNYLHFRAEDEILMKRFFTMLDNITNLYQDINRKDLLRKHKSLMIQVKSQAAQLLVLMEAILTMTGFNFVIGSLRDNYY